MNKTTEDIKNGMSSFRGFFATLSGAKGDERNKYFNNPNTLYDELAILFLAIIWLTVAVVSYFGIEFHNSIFNADKSGNANAIRAVSISILLLGELVKVFVGTRFVMLFLTGELKNGLAVVGLWIAMFLVLVFTYIWSFDISSVAFGSNLSSKSRIEALKSKDGVKGVRESYDKRLQEIDKDIATAEKQTWQGKLTPDAKRAIKASKVERGKVLNLINKEMDYNTKSDSTLLSVELLEIQKTENRVNDYGGKAELLLIFSILCFCLCKKSIDDKRPKENAQNLEEIENVDSEIVNKSEVKSFEPSKSNSMGFGKNIEERPKIQGKEERRFMGFKDYNDIKEIKPDISPIEKKTLIEPIDKKKLYENAIKGYEFLYKTSTDEAKKELYLKGIKGYEFLIKTIKEQI